jgi:hypothetical protein
MALLRYSLKTRTNDGTEVTASGPDVATLKMRAGPAGDPTLCKLQTIRVWSSESPTPLETWSRASKDGKWTDWVRS